MEDQKVSNGWVSVPAFGEWEDRNNVQNYSRQFSLVREARQQIKSPRPTQRRIGNSAENDPDLRGEQQRRHFSHQPDLHHHNRNRRFQWLSHRNRLSYTKLTKIMRYFIKPKVKSCFSGQA